MSVSVVVKLANLHPRMQHNTLVSWLKGVGEPVRKGEPLYLVETRKGVFEVCSEVDGIVESLLAEEKSPVASNQEIAVIAAPGW